MPKTTIYPKNHKLSAGKEKPNPLATPQQLASTRLLSIKELQQDMSVSQGTIWRLIREGKFPPPIHLTGKTRRWPANVYEEWKKNRINRTYASP